MRLDSLSRLPRATLLAAAVVIALLLGAVDYVTGPFFSFTIFYVVPVAIAAWFVGRREALLISLFCAVIWTLADLETFTTDLPLSVDLWNAAVRLSLFLLISWTLATAKRVLDRESAIARRIQRALLPTTLPEVPGIRISALYEPARVLSGDYFDVAPAEDGGLFVCIADVAGKGLGPALLMANLQAAVRLVAPRTVSPAELCRELNDLIARNAPPELFITFFLATIDASRRRLTYSNAGHNPPLLLRSGEPVRRMAVGGVPLGMYENSDYAQEKVDLQPGDRLVLYTDGVTEATDRRLEEFGEQRLIEGATRGERLDPAVLVRGLFDEVRRFQNGPFRDDVTLVVVSVDGEE